MKRYIHVMFLFAFCFNSDSFGVLLYDIDFSPPIHVVGSQMTVGYGPIPRNTPTEVWAGQQIVVSSYSYLTQQPIKMVPGDPSVGGDYRYSQFELDLSTFNYPIYRLDLDMCLEKMKINSWDGFSITFDVPTVVRLDFENNGTISEYNPHNIIGLYNQGELLSMSILVNLLTNTWDIRCNSQHLYTGQFFYPVPANPDLPTYIRSIRFNLVDDLDYSDIPVSAIDNIKVQGIPEPSTLLLLGLGVPILSGFLRRKK